MRDAEQETRVPGGIRRQTVYLVRSEWTAAKRPAARFVTGTVRARHRANLQLGAEAAPVR